MADSYDFLVRRDELGKTAVRETSSPEDIELERGQALLGIDSFSVTANNVTYGAMGEAMKYWRFFPADEGWGRVPAWGYADVLRSEAEGIEAGSRVFGFLPMSTHLVIEAGEVTESGFIDASRHRSELPAVYNRYGFATAEAGDTADREPFIALFAPLFTTSFLIEDWLDDEGFFGARRALISSASSKTALGLAFLLRRDHGEEIESVGLTSGGNVAFTEGTGLYDQVASYDDLDRLDTGVATAYLDFSGSAALRARVHGHLGTDLVSSTVIGAADWQELMPAADSGPVPGPEPGFFFAPTRVAKRNEDWGAAELRRRVAEDQDRFIDSSRSWLTIRKAEGPESLDSTWQAMLAGEADPSEGWTVSP